MTLVVLISIVFIALAFEYINGFHDTANAIATVVSTKVLSPRKAVIFGAVLNFFGALAGTHVAKTIGSGIINTEIVNQWVIISALLSAIIWNLLTWYYAIPSSSSHALIGGLIGAGIAASGFSAVHIKEVTDKVVLPMFFSPLIGFVTGFFVMFILIWMCYKSKPDTVNKFFKKLQLLSSAFMAFSHGSNDAQKTMGIITLALVSYGSISTVEVPYWVIIVCALVMCVGTASGGWRIVNTMGNRVIKLKPIHGFAAETSAAGVIITASFFGIPLSTTHVISSTIMGVGSTVDASAVKWGIVGTIVKTWLLTIPVCMLISWTIYKILSY